MAAVDPKKRKLTLCQWFLALLGVAVSLYLLIEHTRLIAGIQESRSFCALGSFADCDVVNASPYSMLFGMPIAGLGACFYFIILVALVLAQTGKNQYVRFQRLIARLLVFGFVVDVVLLTIQVASLKTMCIFCLLTYLVTLLLFVLTVVLLREKGEGFIKTLKRSLFSFERHPVPISKPSMMLATLCVIVFFSMVFFLPSFVRSQSKQYSMMDRALEQFYLQWKDQPRKVIEFKQGDGVLGSPDAKIRMVAFSDFECPHCRKAAFTLHAALASMKDKIHFVFKHFPLDSSCNSALQMPMHPNACTLAQLAVCAAQKEKFWEFHDQIFLGTKETEIKEGIAKIRERLSTIFPGGEVEECLKSHQARDKVLDDIKQGQLLGIQGTPTLFINGKNVAAPITVETIRRLIAIEEKMN